MGKKGGARHFPKPVVDVGILHKLLGHYGDLLPNFGSYESISRNQATDPKGLMEVIGLLESIVKVSNTCEVHQSTLRTCLLKIVMDKPSLNTSQFNGQVWANTRTERLGVIFAHTRRLKSKDEMRRAAGKLRAGENQRLSELVDKISEKENEAGVDKTSQVDKTSNVSLDSDGYPRELQTPPNQKALTKGKGSNHSENSLTKGNEDSPPSVDNFFFRKRLGERAREYGSSWKAEDQDANLVEAMGAGSKKKPAASCKATKKGTLTKGEKKTAEVVDVKPAGKKWHKLQVTYAKKGNERAYLQGQRDAKSSLVLLVEVTKKRSIHYQRIIELSIWKLKRKAWASYNAEKWEKTSAEAPWQKGVALTKGCDLDKRPKVARGLGKRLSWQKLQEVLTKDFLGKSWKRSWQKTFLAKDLLDKRI